MLKKLLLSSLVLGSMGASAATTGTLNLSGTVAEEVSIAVTAEAGATSLDLTASPTALKVATVNEKSNSNTGYTISAKSANGSLLKNGTADQLAYQISYNNGPLVSLTTSDQTVKTQSTVGVYDTDSDVDIAYTGKPAVEMVEGTYTDTVTFTISAI